MARFFYNLILFFLFPLVIARLLVRSVRLPAYRQRIAERLARFSAFKHDKPIIWVHAVSVGEVIAAVPLIKSLIKQYPDKQLLVTTTTPTGSAQVLKLFSGQVLHVYAPYDLFWVVRRFIKRVKPCVLLVMETEIWPNLYQTCQDKNIPVILANARMSEKSAVGYLRFSSLTRSTLRCISKIAVQGKGDAERFIRLGAEEKQISITGSIKFDLELPNDLQKQAGLLRVELGVNRKIWIAASTHEGEEEILLNAYKQVSTVIDNLLLVLVPRHPDRFDRVANSCERNNLKLVRRSEVKPCASDTQVYLGDSMGELLLLYAVADVAFIGGSLVPVGGHNLLEAAALAIPSVVGPEMFNFAEITEQLLLCNGAMQVQDEKALADAIEMLLSNDELRKQLGANAHTFVEQNKGALSELTNIVILILNE